MKSLRPIGNETTTTLIATEIAEELNAKIASLNNAISAVNNSLTSLQAEVSKTNITKSTGTFNQVTTGNATVSNELKAKVIDANTVESDSIKASSISGSHINSDTVRGDTVSGDTGSFTNVVATNATFDNVTTDEIQTDTVNSPRFIGGTGSFDNVNTLNATIDTLNVTKLNNLNNFVSNNIEATDSITSPLATFQSATIAELESNLAKMKLLFTQNQIYTENEEDPTQYVVLTAPSSSSDETDNYSFIEIPNVHSGFYRIDVKKSDNNYFAVTFINTETAPIVHYSKVIPGDIDGIYYDSISKNLYVKTYASGRIYFSNDDKEGNINPVVYTELPIDASAETTYYYRASGMNRLVIMGDNSLDYGLAVQGVLEANLVKESTQYHQLFFYGNSLSALYNFANKYLTYEDSEGNKHYTNSELAGYLYHTDDSYRDPDNTETEALEKISYDGNTITFTIDNKYGQDEIAIDNEAGTDYVSAGTLEEHTTFNDTATESEQLVLYEGNYSLRQVATVSVTGGEPLVVDLSDSTAVQNLLDTYFRRNDLADGTTYTAKAGNYLFFRNKYIQSITFQAGYVWQKLPYDPDTSTTMSINSSVSEIKLDHSETLALATEENPVEDVRGCYVYTYDDNQQLLDSEGNPLTAVSTTTYTTTVDYHSDFSSDSWYLKRVLKTYYSELDEELYYEDHKVVNAPTKTEIYSAESLIETDYSVPLDTAVYTREALPAEDTLPFIVSFTTGAYKWDLEMNDEVFNSYASERG